MNFWNLDQLINEKSPPGWKGTVKAMKKKKDIDNPYALAWSMKKKGDKPHYKDKDGKPEKKEKYKEDFGPGEPSPEQTPDDWWNALDEDKKREIMMSNQDKEPGFGSTNLVGRMDRPERR